MRDPEGFDAFYHDARGRLLLQAFALTGDLTAARVAVRDTFVVAWHHWPKVAGAADPEAWVREHAWGRAQRRSTARLWHRDRDLDPQARATLDLLAELTTAQRKALLLAELAGVGPEQMARELGLPAKDAVRQLDQARAQLAEHPEPAGLPALWAPLAAAAGEVRWPRGPILRRAGAARRRTHTLAGVAATVAALVVTGLVVTDAAGVHPTLDRGQQTDVAGARGDRPPVPEPAEVLPEESLLPASAFDRALGVRGWTVTATHANTEGDGLVLPCQAERYADRRGTAALVRELAVTAPRGRSSAGTAGTARERGAAPAAYQMTEASSSTQRGRRTFRRTVDWFAGCGEDRAQLLSTWQGRGLGDEATVVALRDWSGPEGSEGPEGPEGIVAGVARSGSLVTTVLTRVPGTDPLGPQSVRRLLTRAVEALCELPDGGGCAARPVLEPAAPVPTGQVPAMLSELDLPPVGEIARPWVGTVPIRASENVAATPCDQASFSGRFEGAPWGRNLTRTFVVPGASMPDEFGLTETVGVLPVGKAREFVAAVRSRVEQCPDEQIGTEVRRLREVATDPTDLSVWEVTTEVSDERSVTFLMALLRRGSAVAQVGFVPAPGAALADGAFLALADRALARLELLPAAPGD